jgi:multidrug efflux system outer membrane protein
VRERALLPLLAALALTACAAGPDYRAPAWPAAGRAAALDAGHFSDADMEREFWRALDDPLLTRLVEEALAANHDLRIALARYERSRALVRDARRARLPSVTAAGAAREFLQSTDQAAATPGAGRAGESYELRVDALWEIDFFGRLRRSVEAQRADSEASAADLAAAQVSIVAELALGYLELRGLQARLAVARDNAANQRRSLELVTAHLRAGRGTELDTARARAQLESTLALIPVLEAEIAARAHRVAVLTGRDPAALVPELATPRPLPALPAHVPIGAPGELLRRRPDILAAERRLAAATARIGIVSADLYPRFTLGALLGTQAMDADALFESGSGTRLLALGIDWSFLDAGRVRARIAAVGADAAAELARYQQTVLRAREEVENALVRYVRAEREREHLARAAAASAAAARQARARYEGGIADFLAVLDAERAQLELEDRLVQSRVRGALGLIALYKALAGGWPERFPVAARAPGR